MQTRISLNIGAACAVVGALGIFLGNFLHPFPPADPEGMLRLIASEPAWSAIHFPTMFFAVAILIALVALSDSITDGASASLARMGRVVAQVGVPVMLVGVAIDGFAFKALADRWVSAPAAERAVLVRVAEGIVLAETGVLHVWVTFFLGLAFVLFGSAVAAGSGYPRPIGWLGVLAGIGCLASGAAGFLRLPLVLPFPVFGTLTLAWTFAMGILMARRARVSGRAPEGVREATSRPAFQLAPHDHP